MSNVHVRNIESGEVKVVETESEEFAALRAERTEDGRFPLWEQTSAGDADPEHFSSDEEIARRSRFPAVPMSDVTSDGIGQSAAAKETLDGEQDTDEDTAEPASNAKASDED